MRVFEIGAVGTAVAYLALTGSQNTSGYPQAALFMAAIISLTLTIGIATAVGIHAWPDDAGVSPRSCRSPHSCHGCSLAMVEVNGVWVCGRCDRVTRR